MEELVGQTITGVDVVIKEGQELGNGIVEVMVPDFNHGLHRACVRRPDGKLGVVRIFESAFVFLDTEGNGKGYADYPMDVREKMNLFNGAEKAQRRAQQLAQGNTQTPQGSY